MKHFIHSTILALFALFFAISASAEVVKLKSGGKVVGSIVFQNEEVVVIKDASGSRYQYLMSDVDSILAEEEVQEEVVESSGATTKRISVGLELSGGAGVLPQHSAGANLQGDLVIGACNILDKKIFAGGALGYHMYTFGGTNYSFLPIQAKLAMPFTTKTNAPMAGIGLGYGISTNKAIKGGLFADIEVGWRHEMSKGRSFFLGAYANFLNAKLPITETIENQDYTSIATRNLCGTGVRFGINL